MDPWVAALHTLTASDIYEVIPKCHFSRAAQRSKESLVSEASQFTGDLRQVLDVAVAAKQGSPSRKRKRDAVPSVEPRTSRRVVNEVEDYSTNPNNFLLLPTSEEVHACQREFYVATSNDSVKESVCAACARRLWAHEGETRVLQDLPNAALLRLLQAHPAHDMYDGLLLVKEALSQEAGLHHEASGWFCHGCIAALVKNKVPALALANQMWIGPVPLELWRLTIPEQLLIAFHYPCCFVFKLFPKNGSPQDPDTLQRGLSGNVTTYELNMPDIADMLKGNLMPRSAQVLASVIAITFIGLGKVPKQWLKNTFRVRQPIVMEALLWLKANNPMYGGVIISDEHL
ncbi:hypothetical protein JB92DRAFT_2837688 [Gautieria morchelliformis]|nr:hypothetical protein JB92DRAFT_2837688 [Gautieria morchelliformis]